MALREEHTTCYVLSKGTQDRNPSPTQKLAIALRSKRKDELEATQECRPVNDHDAWSGIFGMDSIRKSLKWKNTKKRLDSKDVN